MSIQPNGEVYEDGQSGAGPCWTIRWPEGNNCQGLFTNLLYSNTKKVIDCLQQLYCRSIRYSHRLWGVTKCFLCGEVGMPTLLRIC